MSIALITIGPVDPEAIARLIYSYCNRLEGCDLQTLEALRTEARYLATLPDTPGKWDNFGMETYSQLLGRDRRAACLREKVGHKAEIPEQVRIQEERRKARKLLCEEVGHSNITIYDVESPGKFNLCCARCLAVLTEGVTSVTDIPSQYLVIFLSEETYGGIRGTLRPHNVKAYRNLTRADMQSVGKAILRELFWKYTVFNK